MPMKCLFRQKKHRKNETISAKQTTKQSLQKQMSFRMYPARRMYAMVNSVPSGTGAVVRMEMRAGWTSERPSVYYPKNFEMCPVQFCGDIFLKFY